MARKDRAPDPPKRPQGPKRRSTPSTPADAERKRRLLYLIAGSGIAALAVVLAVVLLAGGGGDDERATLEAAGCTLEVVPAQAGEHTAELTATSDPKWNTDPPTSGPHNEQPAVWGSYEDPVPLAQSVHNLEHGGIVVHYGDDVPEQEVEKIRTWYADDPNALLVAPLDKLGDKIALSAWTTEAELAGDSADKGQGFLAKCTRFDENAFSEFRDAHRYKGPERFPEDALHPGN